MTYTRFKRGGIVIICICLMLGVLTGCSRQTSSQIAVIDKTPASQENKTESGIAFALDESSALGGYAVASDSPEATGVGMNVLGNGGNAVDSAVAMALTLAVVEPYASGIGGGGFMLVYDSETGEAWSLDYFASSGSSSELTDYVGVPGFMKGMQTALDQWGTKTLSELINPALGYAENGFTASKLLIKRLQTNASARNNPVFENIKAGDRIRQPELAETLRSIQENGIDSFYSGKIAEDIANMTGLKVSDLTDYQVYCEPAISTSVLNKTIFASTAPSSGVTTLQMLALGEKMDIPSPESDTSGYMETLRDIVLAAYGSRNKKLADPRFYDFDAGSLLSDEFINELFENIEINDSDNERTSTTQFSVIDKNGLVVCVTNSLSDLWGSGEYVDGFFLNDTLSLFGQEGKNAYAPQKRPRTHFSPLIVTGDDGYLLAIGSPGGRNIPQIVFTVLLDILKFGTDVQTSVDKARVLIDEDGYACVEPVEDIPQSIDISQIPFGYYYSGSHMYFGCTSIVGYSPDEGIFAASDMRRVTSDGENTISHLFGW